MNDCPHTSTISISVNLTLEHEDTVMTFLRVPATKCDRCGTVTHLPVVMQELHQRVTQAHAGGGKRAAEWWRGPWQGLPPAIQRQARGAENIKRALAAEAERHPRKGPEPTTQSENRLRATLWGDSPEERDALTAAYLDACGPAVRGNKRLGRSNLYAGLVQAFSALKKRGITLPRNRSLSKDALSFQLGEVLRDHGCTDLSDVELTKNGSKRTALAKRMDSAFKVVADALEPEKRAAQEPPPKIGSSSGGFRAGPKWS